MLRKELFCSALHSHMDSCSRSSNTKSKPAWIKRRFADANYESGPSTKSKHGTGRNRRSSVAAVLAAVNAKAAANPAHAGPNLKHVVVADEVSFSSPESAAENPSPAPINSQGYCCARISQLVILVTDNCVSLAGLTWQVSQSHAHMQVVSSIHKT